MHDAFYLVWLMRARILGLFGGIPPIKSDFRLIKLEIEADAIWGQIIRYHGCVEALLIKVY